MENKPVQYLEGSQEKCQRCKQETAVLISRKEKFCKTCFIRFIRGKQRKQMQDDKYKVKYGEVAENLGSQKVLLAFSGGISSLVLLDVIASLLQEQNLQHKGKQGFELIVLSLDEWEINSLNKKFQDVLPQILANYSPVEIKFRVLSLDSYILDESTLEKISVNTKFEGFTEMIPKDQIKDLKLIDLLNKCPNKSSIEDLLITVYDELILQTAYQERCSTILYGHSMTRIANEIIALTVKGRGSTVYQSVADHSRTYKNETFQIIFPLREILYAEIITYCQLSDLNQYIIESTLPKSKITRNLTIRDLTTNYFTQLDATGYASTASTVVRTGEKLGAPTDPVLSKCQICGVNIHQDPSKWLARITVADPAPIETDEERKYVELYHLENPAINSPQSENVPLNVCYGCLVTLNGIKSESGFIWPVKQEDDSNKPLNLKYVATDTQAILDEYVLTDNEDN